MKTPVQGIVESLDRFCDELDASAIVTAKFVKEMSIWLEMMRVDIEIMRKEVGGGATDLK